MTQTPNNLQDKNRTVGLRLFLGAAFMLALAFISAPLYDLYCKMTGFGGKPQLATATVPENAILDRTVKIRFNTDVAPGLGWSFKADEQEVEVKIGEVQKILYHAQNKTKADQLGVAVFNVQPDRAGLYFNKIQCFCFDEMPMKSGQKAELPVQFFIDPAITKDKQMDDVKTITLSYTFFASKSDRLAAAQRAFDARQSVLLETIKAIP